MARLLVATASLAVLLFSLLSVANCRVLEAELDTDGASSAVVVPDDRSQPNPEISRETTSHATEVVEAGEGFLRLPSHRRHRHPCRHGLHRNLWWARHHGLFHRHGGVVPVEASTDMAVVPTELAHEVEEPREAEEVDEAKAVAEPDPDSRADTDGEQEVEEGSAEPSHGELVKAWGRGMSRRVFNHGLRFHHSRHQLHEEKDQDEEGAGATKRFHHHHHHVNHGDGLEEEETTRKRFHHRDASDGEDEEEDEEMARRWRKAVMRRRFQRFHHGRRHHHHRHAEEEPEKEESGGVMKWLKDLMINRF